MTTQNKQASIGGELCPIVGQAEFIPQHRRDSILSAVVGGIFPNPFRVGINGSADDSWRAGIRAERSGANIHIGRRQPMGMIDNKE